MELQHFRHQHPLVFSREQNQQSEEANCSRCGELVSGPSYSCVACKIHLHEWCAEAPPQFNHPSHPNHNLMLIKKYPYEKVDRCCFFCKKSCENFVYYCSCLKLHIKCAFLSRNIAEKRIGELPDFARIDPSISTENRFDELTKAECFACQEPLLDYAYVFPGLGFYLHAKCVDLPFETNHLFHPEHPLLLQFNHEYLPCKICQKKTVGGFFYCCSLCKFVLHIGCATIPTEINPWYHKHPLVLQFIDEGILCQLCQDTKPKGSGYSCSTCKFALHVNCVCVSSPPIIEDKRHHQHPFILFPRPYSLFSCDACGTQGKYVSYICSTCGIMVHKNCISMPRIIKFFMHQHSIFRTYFLEENEMWECRSCHEEVNREHGGYFCSKCNYIVHVKCATQDRERYYEVLSAETIDEVRDSMEKATATSGRHFSHPHVLEFSEEINNDKQCDGCGQFISTSNYCCSQCDFFLHKSCAELPTEKHLWFHLHQNPMKLLTSNGIFTCAFCRYGTSGFAYVCGECGRRYCIRCASISDMLRCEGHEHLLKYFLSFGGPCNGCGAFKRSLYRCKLCNFNLCGNCARLPDIAQHKSDEHPLKLTYGDNSNYSYCYYCDICEKQRNPKHWFYFCEICNTSAHPTCVIGKYSFIKPGSIYPDHHPHPLTFVKKVHSYPKCKKCDKPCFDLALECKTIGCSYIVHWECMKKWEETLETLESCRVL